MRENGAMRRIALGLTLLLASLSPAAAHPHIWIDHSLTIVFRAGEPAALRVRWTFDAMYSALLRAENVQSRGDTLSRDDVERLRKEAFANLAGYEYFLVIKFGEERLKVPEATSFDARISDGRMVYDFVVPIELGGEGSAARSGGGRSGVVRRLRAEQGGSAATGGRHRRVRGDPRRASRTVRYERHRHDSMRMVEMRLLLGIALAVLLAFPLAAQDPFRAGRTADTRRRRRRRRRAALSRKSPRRRSASTTSWRSSSAF